MSTTTGSNNNNEGYPIITMFIVATLFMFIVFKLANMLISCL
jgi:hypothetical protein